MTTIPNTLREKYILERERLYRLHETLEDAIAALSSGNVASYSLGNRSCTYQNLDQLKRLKDECENKIDEIEALLRGASVRNVTVSTFLDPSIILPRRW